MELTGTIKLIDETKEYGSNGFKKREFVLTTSEQYPQHILVEVVQDKCSLLDKFNVGQEVKIGVNIRGREYIDPQGQAKYFNTIQMWKIDATGNQQNQQQNIGEEDEPDDLAF